MVRELEREIRIDKKFRIFIFLIALPIELFNIYFNNFLGIGMIVFFLFMIFYYLIKIYYLKW
jgi:hypothetical protein